MPPNHWRLDEGRLPPGHLDRPVNRYAEIPPPASAWRRLRAWLRWRTRWLL
jgi:hypothetical protein